MTSEKQKDPKPPRRKRSQKTVKKQSDNGALNNKEVQEAFARLVKEEISDKKKSINNLKSLESLLTQYLNSFILIGYSQDTKEFISLVNAKNEQHADSLSAALNKFILNNSNNHPKNLPPFM